MEPSTHQHLGLGIAAVYAYHTSASLLTGQFVGHEMDEFNVKYRTGNGIDENLSANTDNCQHESS